MLFKATISQTTNMLKKKESVCVFYALFLMVIINFVGNVLSFQGKDIAQMYQPMKLLLLSYNRTNWNATNTLLFIQLYPLLVVCPAGFSLAREYQLGTRIYLVSRLGNFTYQVSKYLSAFLTTMIIFTVPFLLEIILNCLSFPLSAIGDLSNMSTYDSAYILGVNHYFMKNIYLYSPYLYAVMGTLFLGVVSGFLGVFTMAVSSLIKVKYNIFLFLPAFVALHLPTILASRLPEEAASIKWYDYVLMFNDEVKNPKYPLIAIAVIVLLSVAAVCINKRRDCM
jgi:hypothetical protein